MREVSRSSRLGSTKSITIAYSFLVRNERKHYWTVAQLVEHLRPYAEIVSGSSPLGPTKILKKNTRGSMTREEIENKVKLIINEELDLNKEINSDTDLANDLGVDSLDRIYIIMKLEDEFDIDILDQDAEKFTKFGDIINYLENHSK